MGTRSISNDEGGAVVRFMHRSDTRHYYPNNHNRPGRARSHCEDAHGGIPCVKRERGGVRVGQGCPTHRHCVDVREHVEIRKAIAASGINRQELFISTKVPGGLGTAGTLAAHEQNLQQLGMDRVDLLLSHSPCGFPTSPTSGLVNCSKQARQDTWRGLEQIWKAGKARAIGVAHYCQKHLEDILEIATVKISVDREEWHVGMGADPVGLVSFCKQHGISYQSSSPLCGNCKLHKELVTGPLVTSIGKAHNVSGAQVALKWVVQSGSPVTPGSSNPKHLREDLEIFDWTLSETEMAQLNGASSPPAADFPAVCKLQ